MPRFAANLTMLFTHRPHPGPSCIGYAGWIGCEYKPAGRTEDGLAWRQRYA